MSVSSRRHAIGPNDVISVQGRYLVKTTTTTTTTTGTNNNTTVERFLMQGMAFPIAPQDNNNNNDLDGYDQDGWIAVLEQLAADSDLNTVRLYQFNCTVGFKYDTFLQTAATLGIYVIIPLTSVAGDGVLDRTRPAPHCYNRTLYEYGQACVDNVMARHPNVLAGMIGNEVMNALDTWPAAPCVKAYARDLKRYAAAKSTSSSSSSSSSRTGVPLLPSRPSSFVPLFMYAAQHDSPTANVLPDTAMKLTMEYLTCHDDDNDDNVVDDKDKDLWVDIFGINVESWCSSLQTFRTNEDGVTESAYHALWQIMRQSAAIPLVFSEMGCSKTLFNRDNGILPRQVRDWKQVPVVLQDMVDVFSGFCAYTYDGNALFRIMGAANDEHTRWNGHDVLEPSADYDNLVQQLHAYVVKGIVLTINTTTTTNSSGCLVRRPSCAAVRQEIRREWKIDLMPLERMPLYSSGNSHPLATMLAACQAPSWMTAVVAAAIVALLFGLARRRQRRQAQSQNHSDDKSEAVETDPLLARQNH